MTNPLELMTDWIEVNKDLKNVSNRLELYPEDVKLRREKELLEKREAELKEQVNRIRGNC